ncbi:uncharacterized protein LOC115598666 [Calypte anna]|uniref:uncharacterized protein LOC115598666 n=1 Tax=Calypte anna TaxID=9244 RepID=UPI0011C38EFD|nr:uncharacterized protein LOC115598666 [Calypte anna]
MRFPLVLSMTVALCLVSLFSGGFVHPMDPAWLTTGASLEDLRQLLSVAKSTFLSWLGITPLHKPYGLIGMDVAPEDLKPAESSFAECHTDMCLPNHKTCDNVGMDFTPENMKRAPVTLEITSAECPRSIGHPSLKTGDNVGMDFAPEDLKQAPVAFEITFAESPRSIAFPNSKTCDNVRMDVAPEDLKQAPIAAESTVTIAPGSIALRSPPTWISTLMDSIPKGLKQLAVVTQSMASNLPCHLSHLWDYLVQVDRAELLRRTLWFMGPPCVTHMAFRFWRHLQTPTERQVAGRRAPSAIRN